MSAVVMIVSAAAIVLSVKFGLLRGIDHVANALDWSAKVRGQVTGYATSVPELVCLVSAGLAGVWEAGLWNIASSNVINAVLMSVAVAHFRQIRDLFNARFYDEICFALAAIVLPIALMQWRLDTHWLLVPGLLGFFAVYLAIDKHINRPSPSQKPEPAVGSLPFGLILGLSALIAITIAGGFLGNATAAVVEQMGIRPTIAGWILGFVTSIPEMVSFFAVYAVARKEDKLHELNDTQEVLDNLTGSNMSNVGFVYPVGLLVYLVVSLWLGS